MTVEIIVPSLGESVTEATIAKWHKRPGDIVKVDELILELETEKVTLEVNAPASGAMDKILKEAGENVAIGDVVAYLKEGATPQAAITTTSQASLESRNTTTSSSQNMKEIATGSSSQKILSPAATRIAVENKVNSTNIEGTGKDGRVTKGDVLEYINNPISVPQVIANDAANLVDKLEERVRMSRIRKTIAQRLKDSQNTAAILTTFNEIDMTNVMSLRARYRDEFEKKNGVKLGFMSFFVKATVSALKEIPSINAEIDGDEIVYKKFYDIGIAVGTEQGLVVPVLREADKKSFNQIESDIVSFGKRARDGKLSMSDLSGATFSITNGGVYGSLMSTPIINPPQSGILGLHKVQERPMVVAGKVEIRQMMYIALSYDHRIIDGKEAVTFLVKVKEAIENPERLLLGL